MSATVGEEMIYFIHLRPGVDLGYIPGFLDEKDPRPAAEQINEAYAHGGGWRPFHGFTVSEDRMRLISEGDPDMNALAITFFHGKEAIIFYEYEWLAIFQVDGSVEIARIN